MSGRGGVSHLPDVPAELVAQHDAPELHAKLLELELEANRVASEIAALRTTALVTIYGRYSKFEITRAKDAARGEQPRRAG